MAKGYGREAMTFGKRLFDISVALILTLILGPVILILAVVLLCLQGRPVLYAAERMQTPTRGFALIKFRTMTVVTRDSGVSGGDKTARITPMGRVLRRTRLDELPQLWNVLAGHISFVGPRPPLRQYVEKFPHIYSEVLKSRPGITGLATVVYHTHEERLLARATTPAETDTIYVRACVPRKAALDLIYQRRRSLCFDIWLMIRTVVRR